MSINQLGAPNANAGSFLPSVIPAASATPAGVAATYVPNVFGQNQSSKALISKRFSYKKEKEAEQPNTKTPENSKLAPLHVQVALNNLSLHHRRNPVKPSGVATTSTSAGTAATAASTARPINHFTFQSSTSRTHRLQRFIYSPRSLKDTIPTIQLINIPEPRPQVRSLVSSLMPLQLKLIKNPYDYQALKKCAQLYYMHSNKKQALIYLRKAEVRNKDKDVDLILLREKIERMK